MRLVTRLQPLGALERWMGAARIVDSPGDGLRMWIAYFSIPMADDYARWPLPRSLFPLYYGIRPLRLAAKATVMIARRAVARPDAASEGRKREKELEKRNKTIA